MVETTGFGSALLALMLVSNIALAQSGGPGGHGMGPAAAQHSPAGAAATTRPRAGTDYTPGWSMMSKQERDEHRKRLQETKTYEECQAYLATHREQMAERAKSEGRKALSSPRRDACGGLKKQP